MRQKACKLAFEGYERLMMLLCTMIIRHFSLRMTCANLQQLNMDFPDVVELTEYVVYRVAPLLVIFNDLEGNFCSLKPF